MCAYVCVFVCGGGGMYGSFQCQPLYVSGGDMLFLTASSVAAHVFIHCVSS